MIAVTGKGSSLYIHSAIDGSLLNTITLPGYHKGSGDPVQFSKNGDRLLMPRASGIGTVAYETVTGKQLGQVSGYHLHPNGESALGISQSVQSGRNVYQLAEFSVTTNQSLKKYSLTSDSIGYPYLIGLTEDGKRALVWAEHRLFVFDLEHDSIISGSPSLSLLAITISADGSRYAGLITNGDQVDFVVLETATGNVLRRLNFVSGDYWWALPSLHPNGKWFVMPSIDSNSVTNKPVLVDVNSGEQIGEFETEGSDDKFIDFAFSLNGKRLIGAYYNGTSKKIKIWNL